MFLHQQFFLLAFFSIQVLGLTQFKQTTNEEPEYFGDAYCEEDPEFDYWAAVDAEKATAVSKRQKQIKDTKRRWADHCRNEQRKINYWLNEYCHNKKELAR